MRIAVTLFIAAAGLAFAAGAASAQTRSGPELLQAAERSFSAVPFGATEPQSSLTKIVRNDCEEWGECTYGDAASVEHYFWDGELVVKMVTPAAVGDAEISALGIGRARSMDEVVERVRRFLPEAELDCRADGDSTVCHATLGEGWITLWFDDARRLVQAKIDAYHFT